MLRGSGSRSRHGVAVAVATLLAVLGAGAAAASAPIRPHDPYIPAKGRAWHGVSDTGSVADYRAFNKQVRAHTPLLEIFYHWGVPLSTGALDRWEAHRHARRLQPLDGARGTDPR